MSLSVTAGVVWPSTQAGNDRKVAALIYASAFAPNVGESGSSLIGAHPTPPALSTIVTDSAGFVYKQWIGVLKNIAPDIPVAETRAMAVTQGRLTGKRLNRPSPRLPRRLSLPGIS